MQCFYLCLSLFETYNSLKIIIGNKLWVQFGKQDWVMGMPLLVNSKFKNLNTILTVPVLKHFTSNYWNDSNIKSYTREITQIIIHQAYIVAPLMPAHPVSYIPLLTSITVYPGSTSLCIMFTTKWAFTVRLLCLTSNFFSSCTLSFTPSFFFCCFEAPSFVDFPSHPLAYPQN